MKKNEAAYWQRQLDLAFKNPLYKKWRKTTKSIMRRYRNEQFSGEQNNKGISPDADDNRGYNLLYRNVSVRIPFILPFIPKVQVDRTNRDNDNVARTASMILERIANKIIDTGAFKSALDSVKLSAELSNIGVIWVSYNPTETEKGRVREDVLFEFVPDCDFIWQKSKRWEDVEWVGRRIRLTADDMHQYNAPFVEYASDDTDYNSLVDNDIIDQCDRSESTVSVFEIWDRVSKCVYIYEPAGNRILTIYDYPYNIKFPCAKPLSYDTFVDSTVPVSRHAQFLSQYKAVDECNRKITKLKNDLRVAGAYDASVADFGKIFDADNDNKLLGLKNIEKYRDKKMSDMVWMYDPTPAVNALVQLKTVRDAYIEDIQRGVGTYDILEGETNATEAYATNRLKGSFGTMRLQDDQKDAIYFVQDTIRIACDIICQIFEPLSILSYSTIEYSPETLSNIMQSIALLKNSGMKDVRLSISLEDVRSYYDAEYKTNITDMWTAVFTQLTASANMIQQMPEMATVCKEALMSMIRGYKVGAFVEQSMEAAIDNTIRAYQARMNQPQPPSPDMLKAQNEQAKLQLEREKLQIDAQKTNAELQRQAMDDSARAELENKRIQAETAKIISDREINEAELRLKEKELDAEIELAVYQALNPDAKVDTNLAA